MVTFNLMITAEVDNVSSIQPMGGCDDPNFTYYFKVFLSLSTSMIFVLFYLYPLERLWVFDLYPPPWLIGSLGLWGMGVFVFASNPPHCNPQNS